MDWVEHILAGYAYHLNVMPLDAFMPDAGALLRATKLTVPTQTEGVPQNPAVVFENEVLQVKAVPVTHGRAVPALGYRFDTTDGSIVFSGDTTVNDDLIALAQRRRDPRPQRCRPRVPRAARNRRHDGCALGTTGWGGHQREPPPEATACVGRCRALAPDLLAARRVGSARRQPGPRRAWVGL
jgi:hypothetical protein